MRDSESQFAHNVTVMSIFENFFTWLSLRVKTPRIISELRNLFCYFFAVRCVVQRFILDTMCFYRVLSPCQLV